MLRFQVRSESQARWKKGQPAQRTTGVLRANWSQREVSLMTQAGGLGRRCAIARRKTGRLRAAPIHMRRDMSSSSLVSSSSPLETVLGSRAMPQMGQLPGVGCSIWGCIGQV